ncbi:MAG: glycoside hydrolase family 3 N-terminal domain-containing protein, partial [Litorilinea sp.]
MVLLLWANVLTPLSVGATPATRPASPQQTSEQDAEWNRRLEEQVELLLADLSVADRVGQLFVVVFPGNDTGYESDIAELIHGYRIGGVFLTPRAGNFTNQSGVETPRSVAALANRLQALAYGVLLPAEISIPPAGEGAEASAESPVANPTASPAASPTASPTANSTANSIANPARLPPDLPLLEAVTGVPAVNLPLFVGIEQAGDHLPQTALRRGFTPLPSQMALGAAWNPELTRRVGAIVGQELSLVGINLLFGPNLDVVEPPRLDEVGQLGLHSFGGDPFWAAHQARAYITGVHEGGEGRVATVAGHFPGAGDIDRLPEQEIATVQQSLAQLRSQALPPFWAVTRRTSSILAPGGDLGATDALATSPTRYSAFQGGGSGRATPLNLTPELSVVLEQEAFAAWGERGGILVSPPLGLPSIRRYYSPTQAEFPYRRVALDAFSAGHDLLVLDRFSVDGAWETQMRNIQATIGFFQERYVNEPAFAQQVDESVRRILRLKLRLYGFEPPVSDPDADAESGAEPDAESDGEAVETPTATGSVSATVSPAATLTVTPAVAGSVFDSEDPGNLDPAGPDAGSNGETVFPNRFGMNRENLPVAEPENNAGDSAGTPISTISTISRGLVPLADVLITEAHLARLNADHRAATQAVVSQVARESLTTLYPDSGGASEILSLLPQSDEQIVIFTESRLLHECASCLAEPAVGPDEFAEIMLGLYGPGATGQLAEDQITSLTFADLAQVLESVASVPVAADSDSEGELPLGDGGEGETEDAATPLDKNEKINMQIDEAEWIIFAMLDVEPTNFPHSAVVKQFLRERGDALTSKHLVVFALHAPYFLDATELSKLHAYYGVYSKTQPFLENAVRGFFRSYTPGGAPPVSVAGT